MTTLDNKKTEPFLKVAGYCPVCESKAEFLAESEWLRDTLLCVGCGSVPRERALLATLKMYYPHWRDLTIHECSPAERKVSYKLRDEAKSYIGTHFDRSTPFGEMNAEGKYRSEDLENQTFATESFDLVITQDVFEHLFRPDKAIAEIARTLRPGGAHICSFPIGNKSLPSKRRATLQADGDVIHHMEPIYHGNPIDPSGSLVTMDYGYDIAEYFDRWSGLNTTIVYMEDMTRGISGEYIEILVSRKTSDATFRYGLIK
ncbi:methyltransferase domain-containing protein [Methylocystis parvus]|uniref:methyltransferase domain-containing protein n=1 Tax=Methylocystis parvus TaxID=134 RepID=UPI003C741CDD